MKQTSPSTPSSPSTQTAPPAAGAQVPGPKPPSASLYVGDLAAEVNESMLCDIFNTVGPLASIRVCRDSLTRRSLGYAYVNFHSVVDAERALDTLNNHPLGGKPCRIMWSQRDPSIRKTGVGNIFIKNLTPAIGHKELYDTFSAFGNILSCKVALDEQGKSKGYGFVHFENQQCADHAVQMVNNNILLDKKVYVGPFIPRRVRAQQAEKSWTNVFIKDIDLAISDAELHQAFSQFGVVTSAVIMKKKEDGSSLGFGFVNFQDHESAGRAVDGMHQQKLGNKVLYCCRAQKRAERDAKLRKEWEALKISKYQGINLYIKNIEDEIDEERLRKEFSAFGVIKSCKIMLDEKNISKGFGFVCFSTPEESQRAVAEMNSRILPGCNKPLYVAMHEPKEVRRQKLTLNAYKGMRAALPQGQPGAPISYPPGQTVYYQGGNISQGFVYPQQMMQSMPRGWQPQYPVPYSSNVGVMPARGGAAAAANRGRGGGSARGAASGGGRGGANRRGQQVAPVIDAQAPVQEPLTIAQVKLYPVEQQKLYIGERLYALISPAQPILAGKITGMFLESGWPIDELFSLLTDEAKLTEKIDDAIGVLERAQQGQVPEGDEGEHEESH
jgi:polyadenylate-binding protein